MKDFLYNRNNNSFAFVADRWHLENLSTNSNCLDFGRLSDKVFVNSDFSRVRLLTDADAAGLLS
jgi:hypothetical protein